MSSNACKENARSIVISIPWLSNAGVGFLEVPDKEEDTQAVWNNGQGIPLGHPLISVREVNRPIDRLDHQSVPVAVEVTCKPRTTGPLVEHRLLI